MIGYSVWRVARAEAKSDSPNETGAAFTWESVFRRVNVTGSSGISFTLSSKLFKSAGKLKYKLDRAGFLGNA